MKIAVDNENCIPYKKYETDAGWDLKVNSDKPTMIYHNKLPKAIGTGVRVEIPKGYVGLVVPRSGLGGEFEVKLANSIGVIDSDYRGEIKVFTVNKGKRHYKLAPYERFCQLLVVPVLQEKLEVVTILSETNRTDNGFGSTGTVEVVEEKLEIDIEEAPADVWNIKKLKGDT